MQGSTNSSLHQALSGLNALSVIAGVILSIVVFSRVTSWGCEEGKCQAMIFITTTFLSTRRIETTIGWPVATERSLVGDQQYAINHMSPQKDVSYRFGHFLECMYTARMADRTCSPDLEFKDYSLCVTNTTGLVSGMDQCASFPVSGGYYHWPTVDEYLGCITNNPVLRNSESLRASQNVFRSCISRSLWPFFEVPQGIDSSVLMGSFNWALLLVSGFILMTSFGVYQISWKEQGVITNGESSWFMRLGMFWTLVSFAWNTVFFAIFIAIAFRGAGEFESNGGLPTTASTTLVTLFAFSFGVLYFLSVLLSPIKNVYRVFRMRGGVGKVVPISQADAMLQCDRENQKLLLKATFPMINPDGQYSGDYTLDEFQVAKYYTPPLLATWADSYFTDFCFVLGVAGATGQLSTDQAWYLFSFTFVYRVLNMIIARCLSDTYTNNRKLDDNVNTAKNAIVSWPARSWRKSNGSEASYVPHLSTKVIALSTQLAAVALYVALSILVFDVNSKLRDFGVLVSFFVLGFMVPEAIRLALHVFYLGCFDGEDEGVPWMLYNTCFAVWLWDYVVRLIFVCIVTLSAAGEPGTLEFLKTQTNALMLDYVAAMRV